MNCFANYWHYDESMKRSNYHYCRKNLKNRFPLRQRDSNQYTIGINLHSGRNRTSACSRILNRKESNKEFGRHFDLLKAENVCKLQDVL